MVVNRFLEILPPTKEIYFLNYVLVYGNMLLGGGKMNWFDILKVMKRESGMTTLEISKKCGVPEPTLEKLFSGFTKDPKLSTITEVVHCLGYTLDDLSPPVMQQNQLKDEKAEQDKTLELLKLAETLNIVGKSRLLDCAADLNKIQDYKA